MSRENPGQLTAKVQRWLADILRAKRAGGVGKVSREIAKARARICAACPMQRDFSGVCSTCTNQRKATRQAILGSESPVNPKLRGCLVLEIDTSLAVHLAVGGEEVPGLPHPCWWRDGV